MIMGAKALGRHHRLALVAAWYLSLLLHAPHYLAAAVPDPDCRFVVVDLLEFCHVWWQLPFAVLGGPTVYLHTVLELEHTPEVKTSLEVMKNFTHHHISWVSQQMVLCLSSQPGPCAKA